MSAGKTGRPLYRVQVIDRALAILDSLALQKGSASLADLAESLHMHKSTVHRLMMSLERHRIIERDPRTGQYCLGMRLFELGSVAINRLDLRERAHRYMEKIMNHADETVHLCTLDQGEVLYLDKLEPSRSVRMACTIGRRNPAHCTAVGKAMLAWLPESEVEEVVQRHGMRRMTPKTITTLAELKAELARIRGRGYAIDDEEIEEGVRCVAAPVMDHLGLARAAISISAPSFRLPVERIPVLAELVMSATRELSVEWGYQPQDERNRAMQELVG